jgi:hypothetical protein
MKEHYPSKGYVYFLSNPLFPYGLVKIGIAKDVVNRVAQLSTSVPYDYNVCMLMKTPDYKELERKLHLDYRNQHVNREFFILGDDDLKDIHEKYDEIILDEYEYPDSLVKKTGNHFEDVITDIKELFSYCGEKVDFHTIKEHLLSRGYP